ncbi:cadherin-like domain-containing protein [Sphingomonas sp. BN140010]|uniref:Cadherin-like domain-containing protein n=1 Tax=Sphingomonas arvum TaxID=2992113 RepID=A0ABT3JC96_9SPHN|nr:cadherin-like domain-containing protein [Sphingomonas sp. BN140010]MCW3796695.1 cadherin-like domain-containing protein [Sphingomonas sp. BN140010]
MTVIISGSDSTQRTLAGTELLWVSSATAKYRANGPVVTWSFATPSSSGVRVDNYGLIESLNGRVFDTGVTAATAATSFDLRNQAGASIIAATDVMRVQASIAGGKITISNSGLIQANAGRGFDIQEYQGLASFSFTNNTGSSLQSTDDGFHFGSAIAGSAFTGTIAITNSGTIKAVGAASGQAIDLSEVIASVDNRVTVTNNAGATIEAADSDAIRGGRGTKIVNSGTIRSRNFDASSTGNDAIDFGDNARGAVNNLAGGQIIGARHGITGTQAVTISNSGAITGQAGSGIRLDTAATVTSSITSNSGASITGNAAAGTDGDAIHVGGLISLDNGGTISAIGGGTTGLTEAISAGGGQIYNYSSGLIVSSQRAITIDDGFGGSAFAAVRVINYGTITGQNGEAISITGSFGDTIYNYKAINGSISTDGGNDQIVNYGVINGAISLGAGDDSLSLLVGTVGTVDGGAGTDSITVVSSGTINGALTGVETIVLGSTVYGTLATLDVNASLGGAEIRFIENAQTLKLGAGAFTLGGLSARLTGFSAEDRIDLAGFVATSATLGAGNVLTVTGANGSLTIQLDPAQDFSGSRFAITSDGAGGSLLALVANAAPVASASANAGNEDAVISGSVAATDPNGDVLSYALVSGPQHGTLTFNPDGTYSYAPDADFNGTDAFSFKAGDGALDSAPATVSLTVNPLNDAPVLSGTPATLPTIVEDQAFTVTAADLLAGFSDVDGDGLSVANLSASSGTVTDNGDGTWTVRQAADVNGIVALGYSVVDGHGGSVDASLRYVITAVNDAPVLSGVQAALASGTEDAPYAVTAAQLLEGFNDVDGDTLSVANLMGNSGTITRNGDGSWTITQAPDANGPVTLGYDVVDGNGGAVTATRTFMVQPVNDNPIQAGQPAALPNGSEDVAYTVSAAQLLSGFTDVDGDPLSVADLTTGRGTVQDNGDGSWTIMMPANGNGTVTLDYRVVDGRGGSVAASLTYEIEAVNDGPALTGAQAVLDHGTEDVAYTVTAAQLLAGFTDADGDALAVAGLTASRGSVVNNGNGTWTVTQARDANGPVTLSYNVVDGHGGSLAASVGYTVDAVNDAPIAPATPTVLANGTEDVAYTVSAAQLLAGFTDVDGDALAVAGLTASRGSVVNNGNGTWTVTQARDANGPVTLSYNVVDGHGGSLAASLGYTVDAVNDAPTGGVTIAGTPATGQQLRASSTIADADGLGPVFYQWLLDGRPIIGATGQSYVIAANDLNHLISVTASYTDGGGVLERVTSSVTPAIVLGAGTFTGTAGADTLTGSNFDDALKGLAGNDVLRGLDGNDVLNGGAGNDTLDGGLGNDTGSYVDATAGVKVSLAVSGAQNTGGSGFDTLIGIENLLGSAYGDTLTGDAGANRLTGGGGADTLTGGGGADTFVFDLLTTIADKDTIKDFVSGVDHLELSLSAFAGLAGYGGGQMGAGELTFGKVATSTNQHLLYDASTGALIYDADGSGAGAAVTIAVLSGQPTLAASDIYLI